MEEVKEYEISQYQDDLTIAYRYGEMIYSYDPRSHNLMASSEYEIFDIPFNPQIETPKEAIAAHINYLIDTNVIEYVAPKYSLINVLDDNEIPYKFENIYDFLLNLGVEKEIIFEVLTVLDIKESLFLSVNNYKLMLEYFENKSHSLFQELIKDFFNNISSTQTQHAYELLDNKIIDMNKTNLTRSEKIKLTKYLWENGYKELTSHDINHLFSIINKNF